jgi:hypothetical protein
MNSCRRIGHPLKLPIAQPTAVGAAWERAVLLIWLWGEDALDPSAVRETGCGPEPLCPSIASARQLSKLQRTQRPQPQATFMPRL